MKDIFEEIEEESFVDKIYFDESLLNEDEIDEWDLDKADEVDDWDFIHILDKDWAK